MLDIHKQLKFTIIFFLGTSCPITQNTTLELNRIFDKYCSLDLKDDNLPDQSKAIFEFHGKFPNYDDDTEKISIFKEKYNIIFNCSVDSNQYFTNKFAMSTLPEVVIFNADSVVLYKGKIDDLYFDIGKRRQNEYKRILDLKLDTISNMKSIVEKYVSPVGCVIEKKN